MASIEPEDHLPNSAAIELVAEHFGDTPGSEEMSCPNVSLPFHHSFRGKGIFRTRIDVHNSPNSFTVEISSERDYLLASTGPMTTRNAQFKAVKSSHNCLPLGARRPALAALQLQPPRAGRAVHAGHAVSARMQTFGTDAGLDVVAVVTGIYAFIVLQQ